MCPNNEDPRWPILAGKASAESSNSTALQIYLCFWGCTARARSDACSETTPQIFRAHTTSDWIGTSSALCSGGQSKLDDVNGEADAETREDKSCYVCG